MHIQLLISEVTETIFTRTRPRPEDNRTGCTPQKYDVRHQKPLELSAATATPKLVSRVSV